MCDKNLVLSPCREAFNLVTNADAWNTPTNLFKCFVVCFLVKCLERAGYFKGSVAEEKDKAFIGEVYFSNATLFDLIVNPLI